MGGYTRSKSNITPFRLKYFAFSCSLHVFTATATADELQASTFVTLTFISQNNRFGVYNIDHKYLEEPLLCPKAYLIRRTLHVHENSMPPSTPPSSVMTPNGRWKIITPQIISNALNNAIKFCIPDLLF